MISQMKRVAGLLLAAAVFLNAQGSDVPIIISDGSLTIDATVSWAGFLNAGANKKAHPQAAKTVSKVVVTVGGKTQTFSYSNQLCKVAVKYAGTDIVVVTDNSGKALQIQTDFKAFQAGAKPNLLAHTDTHQKISSVTITRGADTVFTAAPSGGTKIAISYQ